MSFRGFKYPVIQGGRTFKSARSQRGYAAVLTPIFAGVMLLTIFSLYDVGQVTSHKMRSQNAADAGAYSVSTVIARDMNFIASTNRMMAAHQATTGQFIGLVSYTTMLERSATNLDRLANVASIIGVGVVLKTITTVLKNIASGLNQAIEAIAIPLVYYNNTVITAVSGIQSGFHLSMLAAGPELYQEVIKDNDPDVQMSGVLAAAQAGKLVKEYRDLLTNYRSPTTNDENTSGGRAKLGRFDDFAKVAVDGGDNFTESRHRARWFSFLNQRGGSEFQKRRLNNDYVYDWTAVDTLEFRLRLGPFTSFKIPVGWGAAHALNVNDSSSNYNYWQNRSARGQWGESGEEARRNPRAFGLAAFYDSGNNIARGVTIKPFYDLTDDKFIDRGPAMLAVLQKGAKETRVWKEASKDIPNYTLQDGLDVAENGGLAKDQVVVVGKAEIYFSRAPDLWRRSDNKIELGNMFNPFWQARLTELTLADKTAVLTFAGVTL